MYAGGDAANDEDEGEMRRRQQRASHIPQLHACPPAPAPGGRGSTNPRFAYAPLEIRSNSAADASLSPRSHSASPASERGASRTGAAPTGMCAAAPGDARLWSDGPRPQGGGLPSSGSASSGGTDVRESSVGVRVPPSNMGEGGCEPESDDGGRCRAGVGGAWLASAGVDGTEGVGVGCPLASP